MKNSNKLKTLLILPAIMSAVLVLCGPSKAQPPSSAQNSPPSAIRVSNTESEAAAVNACSAAADELRQVRALVTALEKENSALRQRLEVAVRTETILVELNGARQSEAEALRLTVAAKNETIAAKDAALARQDELVEQLRRRKTSPWKRLGDVLVGIGVAAILR